MAANHLVSVAFLLVAVVDPFSSADLDDPDNPPLDDRLWLEAVFIPGKKDNTKNAEP
ncbi:MAG: hypothetical protein M0Z36_11235 [Thermaerobacter sp.]|nr:hypothetical protein [Thermaerobacter sp.]